MGYKTNNGKASTPKLERYHRANKIYKLKPTSLLDNVPTSVVDSVDSQNTKIEEPIIIHKLEQLKTKYAELQNEVDYLNLSEKSFVGRENMFTYYIGLESIAVFNLILDHIKPGLNSKNQRLSEFQKLLLWLMKLRLNLPLTDLGFRFNISCSTASIIFRKVIYLLEHMFKKDHTTKSPYLASHNNNCI
ncbi:hypothetical protein ACI65C_004399 [Semiaphis heraclei]